jgi:hypothetical protein
MKKILLGSMIALAGFAALPAHAANVTVTLEVRAGHVSTPTAIACAVSVPAGSDGVAVLAKAKSTGCISEYTVQNRPPYGRFVLSIENVRGAAEALDATYWSMTVNGTYTSYGIDGFQAASGQKLGFTYTTWLNCLLPQTCI